MIKYKYNDQNHTLEIWFQNGEEKKLIDAPQLTGIEPSMARAMQTDESGNLDRDIVGKILGWAYIDVIEQALLQKKEVK